MRPGRPLRHGSHGTDRRQPLRPRRDRGGSDLLSSAHGFTAGGRGRKTSIHARRIRQVRRPLSPPAPRQPGTVHKMEHQKCRHRPLRRARPPESLQHSIKEKDRGPIGGPHAGRHSLVHQH